MTIIRMVAFIHLGQNHAKPDVTCKLPPSIPPPVPQHTNNLKPGNSTQAALWSRVEPGIGLVSACLPSMVYLFRKAVNKISPTLYSKPNSGGRGYPSSGAPALNKRKARKFERLGDEQSMSKFSPTAGSGTWDKEIMVWETGIPLRDMRVSGRLISRVYAMLAFLPGLDMSTT